MEPTMNILLAAILPLVLASSAEIGGSVLIAHVADAPGVYTPGGGTDRHVSTESDRIRTRSYYGTRCGNASSLEVEITNVSDGPVTIVVHTKRTYDSAETNSGPARLQPGRSVSYWWCDQPYDYRIEVR
jgi:hypothetical protein